MSWQDLLQSPDETVILPWTGGRSIHLHQRSWKLNGPLPKEFGWYEFKIQSRKATLKYPAEPKPEILSYTVCGYLIGDRIVPDNFSGFEVDQILSHSYPVYLIEPGLARFTRIEVGRTSEHTPYIFKSEQMPLGPEEEVLSAYLDNKESVHHIKNVSPVLDAAFRLESWYRAETARRRAEVERQRREQEEAERRKELYGRLGDAVTRREVALTDFESAARAALQMGGAEYLDHRQSHNRNEMIVQYRLNGRRFECVCDKATLKIIDSGICLRDHRTGEVGDTRFSLESIPAVILEAIRERKLHVFRNVDDNYDYDDYDDYDD